MARAYHDGFEFHRCNAQWGPLRGVLEATAPRCMSLAGTSTFMHRRVPSEDGPRRRRTGPISGAIGGPDVARPYAARLRMRAAAERLVLCYAEVCCAEAQHTAAEHKRALPHEYCAQALRRQNNSAADARGMSCMRLFSVRAEESLKWSEVGCERRREQRESYRDAVAT